MFLLVHSIPSWTSQKSSAAHHGQMIEAVLVVCTQGKFMCWLCAHSAMSCFGNPYLQAATVGRHCAPGSSLIGSQSNHYQLCLYRIMQQPSMCDGVISPCVRVFACLPICYASLISQQQHHLSKLQRLFFWHASPALACLRML